MSVVKLTAAEWRDLGTLGQYVVYLNLCSKYEKIEEALRDSHELTMKAQDRADRLLNKIDSMLQERGA